VPQVGRAGDLGELLLAGHGVAQVLDEEGCRDRDECAAERTDEFVPADVVRDRYTSDPHLSAGLLIHLLGENAMPPYPGRWAAYFMRVRNWIPDQALTASIADLYAIRRACACRDPWWMPARIV
jgi:hypothetical protein